MKLKKLIKLFDPLNEVVIWTPFEEDGDDPAWQGTLLDLPWHYLDYKVSKFDKNDDEPIRVSYYNKTFSNGAKGIEPILIFHLVEPEEE